MKEKEFFCSNCGTKLEFNTKECPNCGSIFENYEEFENKKKRTRNNKERKEEVKYTKPLLTARKLGYTIIKVLCYVVLVLCALNAELI